ncbi:hypothetical protein ZWY2020_038610 [Hordeum vulgare]|nr:hypothetical protein ZWY2020_038610 [Hordeum vulgare]
MLRLAFTGPPRSSSASRRPWRQRAPGGMHLALGATGSGILAVTLAVVQIYLGWAYSGYEPDYHAECGIYHLSPP